MTSVLLSALAATGAAEHLVSPARALRARGHRVSVVTAHGSLGLFRDLEVEVWGVDEPVMPALLPGLPPVARRANQLYTRVQRNVIDPMAAQAAVIARVVEDAEVQVIVTDALFLGASMLSVKPRSERPAIIMLGFFAPWIPDPHVPPYGLGMSPADNAANRVRAAAFEVLAGRAYSLLSRSFNANVAKTFGVTRRGDLRSSPEGGDVWAQLTVPRFEYPRTQLPANFRFIGPLHPEADDVMPSWWDPLEEPPVVVVHGKRGSSILDVVLPTVRAFGGTNTTVLITGESRHSVAAANAGPLPENVHFERRPPWSRLLPGRTVMVCDGDYLFTQHALRFGIPVVVAGTLETDVETAARVAWSGVGINLRSSRPDPSAIHDAVGRILADNAFAASAARIAAQIGQTDAEAELCEMVERFSAA